MADKKHKPRDEAMLARTSMQIKDDDGTVLNVPVNSDENRIAGALMATKLRRLIMNSMKYWQDTEVVPTPKELADLASAAAKIESFAGELFKGPEIEVPDKSDNETQAQVEEVKFDVLAQPKPPETKP